MILAARGTAKRRWDACTGIGVADRGAIAKAL
jgi:hypothetical protein